MYLVAANDDEDDDVTPIAFGAARRRIELI